VKGDKYEDARYVYSACCTWHGSIHEVKTHRMRLNVNGRQVDSALPGCPHCGSPLMEYPSVAEWSASIEKFMAAHPELPLYCEWMASLNAPCRPLKDWDWRADYQRFAEVQTKQ
jgi:hypothetical protein